ncbi:hypothetical protein BD310DRAFT_923830 [Dichomitus squalens]|uniref:REJ domain-containing protein n=1 Tax=Dichomitus squalens TaxID=114155 RepID=A0A4Q9PZI1_9APHY|nr:hypothetical protein BD310DRAFT_923830 [Dichomitus squalens]
MFTFMSASLALSPSLALHASRSAHPVPSPFTPVPAAAFQARTQSALSSAPLSLCSPVRHPLPSHQLQQYRTVPVDVSRTPPPQLP